MKKNPILLLLLSVAILISCQQKPTPEIAIKVDKPAESSPEVRWKEEFDMLKNPYTNKIPTGIRQLELEEAATIPLKEEIGLLAANNYIFVGPSNIGGRCRAIAHDMRYNGTSNQVILAGGVSGGMFRSTNGGLDWTRVSSLTDIHNVTCVAQDPRPGHQDTWYFGTGEGIGSTATGPDARYVGYGIYKSTDNGVTWNLLLSTAFGSSHNFDQMFDLVTRIAVHPNGNVYAATASSIWVSADGGNNWALSRPSQLSSIGTSDLTDVAITSTGIVYASLPGAGAVADSMQGIWKLENSVWTRIAGGGTPSWFNSGQGLGRIVLGLVPSNPNLVYALYEDGTVSNCNTTAKPEAELGLYNNISGTWTDLSANLPDEPGCFQGIDPFTVQGGYDLMISVKPDNPNIVFVGGTNLYVSTDGFTSTANTTRVGGYLTMSDYSTEQARHPDYHTAVFAPNNPNILLTGTDGGVSETNISTPPPYNWIERNTNFNTLQYYYVAIDPTASSNFFIGGCQDNGITYRNAGTNNHNKIFSGDGISVGISSNNNIHYISTQFGEIYKRASNQIPNTVSAFLTPPGLSPNKLFHTLFHLDPDNSTTLYYADFNRLYRNARADTVTQFSLPANRMQEVTQVAATIGTHIRSFATSHGAYNAISSKLYFGTSDGKVFRLDDPAFCATNTAPVQINSGAGMPTGTIISLAVNPRNADTVLAVYSNYGIVNIWFCGNATSASPTWTAIEGNLDLPSIRSAAIVAGPQGVDYYVGTSTGLYSTLSLNGNSTVWMKEGAGTIGNAVVTDLKLRTSDNRLLVGTHGNGMFTTDVILPVRWGNFVGNLVNGQVELKWETLLETQNKGFDVEKSNDGFSFEKIGYVPANRQSATSNTYKFTDVSKLLRAQYYRIRQIDFDGRSSYSKVVKIILNELPLSITSMVNPISTNLIFTLNDAPANPLMVSITDVSGKTLFTQIIKERQGNIYRFNTSNLPNGTYFVQIQSGAFKETRKIIKRQ